MKTRQNSVTDVEKKIYKHAATIHCSGELTLFQRKIINCLLYNAYPVLYDENKFKIRIRDLLNLMGLSNNDYQYLRKAFRDIRRTDITWNLTFENFKSSNDEPEEEEQEFETWIDCSWLSWAMSDGSTIHYEFPAPLKAYLKDPAVYAAMSLTIQKKFTSKFALILYENCVRYVDIGKTKIFSLETFRKIMGVKDTQYKEFRSLNSRVIKPAIKQLNDMTDISVEPIFKRVNRKVNHIQFTIRRKVKKISRKRTEDFLKNKLSNQNTSKTEFLKFHDYVKRLQPLEREKIINSYLQCLEKHRRKKPGDVSLLVILEQYKTYGWECRIFIEGLMRKHKANG